MNMNVKRHTVRAISAALLTIYFVGNVNSHGLVEDPPSRNWVCGAITKPDQVLYGDPLYPECGEAFATDMNGSYSFMSVLTHTRGRASVTPLPDNVCGFDAETFNDGATPWDQPADWPTSPMSAGPQDFTWNISWGSHFSDTEEFRFWMTTPDFEFDRNGTLSWDDFETEEFCVQLYDDSQATANPAVTALKGSAQFEVRCDVPERQGRHVIYAEWGRNEHTLERFHGCIDVVFGDETSGGGDTPTPTVPAPVAAEAVFDIDVETFIGSTSLELDGSASLGDDLSYSWTINASDPTAYSFDDASSAVTTLNLENPDAAQNVTVTLTVTSGSDSNSSSDTFIHEPEEISTFMDLGPLVNSAMEYSAGDQVSVRTVTSEGVDSFNPEPALTLDDSNSGATQWPLALANAVNIASGGSIAVGVLGSNGEVVPVADATANRVYAAQGSNIVSAFLVHVAAEPTEPPTTPEPVEPPTTPEPVEPPTPPEPIEPPTRPEPIDPPTTPEPIDPPTPPEPIDPPTRPEPIEPPTTPEPIEPPTTPEPVEPIANSCTATIIAGNNPYWAGFDVAVDVDQFTLDWSSTGVDLSAINVSGGVFNLTVEGQLMTLTKPSWVSSSDAGYLGLHGVGYQAYEPLATLVAPTCSI